jgi:hypothetical protein
LAFLAACLCLALARNGSISEDLLDDDDDDDVIDDEPMQESEPEPEVKRGRRPSLCAKAKCGRGRVCQINAEGKAECPCAPDCEYYRKSPAKTQVCSKKNVTYDTECDLDRDHYLCRAGKAGCRHPKFKKVVLDYYGQCTELKPCTEESRKQFPDRLRNWLFVVMEEMANRANMGEYEDLLKEAEEDENHSYAAIWGFCDLDKDPQDRHVSKRELQYTRRSLKAFEHCLNPFLDDCDEDDNGNITLTEWGKCLRVPHDKITDRCKVIHGGKSGK